MMDRMIDEVVMPKLAKELGPLAVGRLAEPGFYFVGGVPGLALLVSPTGARQWVLRVVVGGKRRDMGIGGFPAVTLAGAREAARDARLKIANGIDPIGERRAAQDSLRAAAGKRVTFREAAGKYIEAHESGWKNAKHRQQWENTLAQYAFPKIGDLQVRDIELPHVLSVLAPIWRTRTETASRVRSRMELVLDWATASGYRDGLNPARWRGHLDKLLPKPSKVATVEHHAALPVAGVGQFMQRLRSAEGMGARALEFGILCASRSGEVRGATWAEIDTEGAMWTIPGARMKAGNEHRVPLSPAALKLLKALPRDSKRDSEHDDKRDDELVFPAPRGGQLSDMTLSAVLRRMEVPATVHGFRSTFRDWAAERTNYPSDMAEMALAHVISDKVEAAYRRGDMLEKRRQMMTEWAKFCAHPRNEVSSTVLVLSRNAARG